MSKSRMKIAIAAEQDGLDPLTGESLAVHPSLLDTDRLEMKSQNGTYMRKNTRVLNPVSHMERHGTLRVRETTLDDLKSIFDDRLQMMKLMLKINNQLLAYGRRTDLAHPETAAFLEAQKKPIEQRLAQIDASLAKALKAYPDPLAQSALGVAGLGPITVAALTVYVDFKKQVCSTCHKLVVDVETAPVPKPPDSRHDNTCKCKGAVTLVDAAATPSALWKYVGLHTASHERYVKGTAGGGNKTLRTVLWNTANVMMKLKTSAYREVYDRTKLRLSISEKVVTTRNTAGKSVELPWKDTKPSHRHGAALRAIMKHLLADYWFVGRTLAGLSTVPLYAESMLGHTHIIAPANRGWKFSS